MTNEKPTATEMYAISRNIEESMEIAQDWWKSYQHSWDISVRETANRGEYHATISLNFKLSPIFLETVLKPYFSKLGYTVGWLNGYDPDANTKFYISWNLNKSYDDDGDNQ